MGPGALHLHDELRAVWQTTCHAGAYEDIFDPCVDGGAGSDPDSIDAADSATDGTNTESGTDGE